MRVLLVGIELDGPGGYSASQFLPSLARALAAEGVETRQVILGDRDPVDDGRSRWVPISRQHAASLRQGPPWLQALAHRRAAGLLRPVISQECQAGFDVIHAHWCFPAGLALTGGQPSVLTLHGADERLLERSWLARRAAGRAVRSCSLVTAVSPAIAVALQTFLGVAIPDERIRGMPVELEHPTLTEGGGGALVLSPLRDDSRVSLAIEAIACLAALDHPLHLLIAGEGPDERRLQHLAERRGVGQLVRFVGRPDGVGLRDLLSKADVLLDPARGIGFARQQALAAMAGVAVVACWDGGGTLRWRANQPLLRLVVPSGEAIADAVLDLLGSPGGAALRREAGQHFRIHLASSSVARKCIDWYREALQHPRPLY